MVLLGKYKNVTKRPIFLSVTGRNAKNISRRELHDYIKEYLERFLQKKINYMENCLLNITHCPAENVNKLKRELRYFKLEF